MMNRTLSYALPSLAALLAVSGCATDVGPEGAPSKAEAADLYAGGKADHIDWCAELDWYGDGICDTFCPLADQDCTGDECTVGADYTCGEGETCTPGYCYFYCPPDEPDDCCVPASCEPIDDGDDDFCATALCGPGTLCNEETDSCEPFECPPVVCALYCENGFDTGEDGCPVCRCIEPDEPYEPCADKSCGDTCTICAPDDADCVETSVVKQCQPDGSCAATVPMCPAPDCRETGCGEGQYCSFCWGSFQCIPDGAVC